MGRTDAMNNKMRSTETNSLVDSGVKVPVSELDLKHSADQTRKIDTVFLFFFF